MHIVNNDSVNGIDAIDVKIFEGKLEGEISPMYAGAGIGFNLAGGEASIFDFNLGIGVSTGVGLKDESVEIKVAGTGITIGRKLSISVLDNSFGIDLVRGAQAVWYVKDQLIVAVAVVPGAMANGGEALLEELKKMPGAFEQAGIDLWSQLKLIPGAFATIPGAFADAGSEIGGMIWSGVSGLGAGAAAAAMKAAGYSADVVSGVLKSSYGLGADAAAGIMKGADFTLDAITEGLGAAYNLTEEGMKNALESAGFVADKIYDAMKSTGKFAMDKLKDIFGGLGGILPDFFD